MTPETLRIRVQEDILEALHFEHPGARQILFCHGFPGIYKHLDLAEDLSQAGFGVVVMKYRGVDSSTGHFNFLSAIEDVAGVTRFVAREGIAPDGIGVFAYSIGAYYALNVAVDTPAIKAVCALSPVTDLPRAARVNFENIYQLMLDAQALIRINGVHDLVASFAEIWRKYNLPDRVRQIQGVPLLIIDGTNEDLGDPEQSRILYAAANEPKQLHWLTNAGHYFESPEERKELSKLIQEFFQETLVQFYDNTYHSRY